MRKLWLIFAQSATISLAVVFVLSALRPGLLPWPGNTVVVKQAPPSGRREAVASYSDAAKKAMPSVVNIFTTKEVRSRSGPFADDPLFRFFFGDRLKPRPRQVSSLGSGVIVSPDGYILTNHHVVEAADEIQVALEDGKTVQAHIVGTDPDSDLAVVKVALKNLHAITFGTPGQSKVGDVVLAIGDPFGVGQTVTMGIVSALGRSHLGINTFEDFIQTDAPINPGNSGGALVNTAGELIGINSAIYSRSGGSLGIGFAIPVSIAKQVMEQIIEYGKVIRGWIGVEVQDITPELAESFKLPSVDGALIAGVLRGGPADRAGISPGDILLAVNGAPVSDSSDMLNKIAALPPGKLATLTILRHRTQVRLRVSIAQRPKMRQPQLPDEEDD